MSTERNIHLDLFALALLALVVFLSASLGTYDPADSVGELIRPLNHVYQPNQLVYPANEEIRNGCGWWGALAADVLFSCLGLGAYYLVASLALLDALLLARREIDMPVVRATGWAVSLVGLTAIASLTAPTIGPGTPSGAGGYLGIIGCGLLESHLALTGSLIVTGSLVIGGLFLCTDYALLHGLSWSYGVARTGVSAGVRALPRPRARVTDLEDEIEIVENEDKGTVGVRVRPKATKPEPVEADEEIEAEAEEELLAEDEELESEVAEPVVKKRQRPKKRGAAPKPHFKIKRKLANNDREEVMSKLDAATFEAVDEYELPDMNLLIEGDDVCFDEQVKEVRSKAKMIEKTFASFGFKVRVVEIETGPVIAQYEVELEAGLRLSKITGLADDLAIALRVPSVRIVAPIPGKNTVGIEVPNEVRQIVRLREVIEESNGKTRKMKIPIFLGKDVSGNPLTVDLASLPHLLIAGRTGTGKSVCLNAIISSILMTKKPDEVRMLMIDPKMVELSGYGRLPHLMHPVVTDMRKAEAILAWAVDKMEERYAMLARAGVRHISSYNQLGDEELRRRMKPESEEEWAEIPNHLPFIVIVADEIADLMMTAGKDVEQHIIRLAQKSRAVGIHLILATQKPTVDVITGLIKSNLPARISFQVASRTDSRVVLDEMGADKLLGNGDMLFLWPGTSTLLRGQGTYLADEEIESVVDSVSTDEQNFVNELVNLKVEDPESDEAPGPLKKRDDLYESAVDIVVREGRGSVSLLQRSLGIGYGRAARLIDFMAEDGIVGPYAGSQAREILISPADWEAMQNGGDSAEDNEAPSPRRSNKVAPALEWTEDEEGDDDAFGDGEWEEGEYEEYEAESA